MSCVMPFPPAEFSPFAITKSARDSRIHAGKGTFDAAWLTDETIAKVRGLSEIAKRRGQSLAQMALAWALRDRRVTSVVVGASSVRQFDDSLGALDRLDFTDDELIEIDRYAIDAGVNSWEPSSTA